MEWVEEIGMLVWESEEVVQAGASAIGGGEEDMAWNFWEGSQ